MDTDSCRVKLPIKQVVNTVKKMVSKIANFNFPQLNKFWKSGILLLIIVFLFVSIYYISSTDDTKDSIDFPLIVIRVDDIQDYAFRDAQLFLLNHSITHKVPLSLAVIPKVFGEDTELVETTVLANKHGCEVVVHGWEHENLSQFGQDEQSLRLLEAKQHLEETLNINCNVLVPPMFSYNNDTLRAMEENGYEIISGIIDFHEIGWSSERILSLPATIELSVYDNETWQMKNMTEILREVEASIDSYNYAMIVTHPQEFMKNGALSQKIASEYEQILQVLIEDYNLGTIEDLSGFLR
ncbi:MAG: hypothetical protein CW691_02000 [Candidatus Bathyarchaeum sp.]|nr:MAG: hypothetical protein CW691_02000 [Candidatus Bathyarchaeum sp.]